MVMSPRTSAEMTKDALALWMAGFACVIWGASSVVGFIRGDYTPMAITTPVALVAMTFAMKNGGSK